MDYSGWPLVWKTRKCLNLTAVREMSGILLKIGEMSGNCQGKNLVREKLPKQIVNCIFVSIQVFSRSLLCLKSIWFRIMYCCIPAPTTDSNTSTGMIWVTINMPSAVKECREPSGNHQGISHCLESGHPAYYSSLYMCMACLIHLHCVSEKHVNFGTTVSK